MQDTSTSSPSQISLQNRVTSKHKGTVIIITSSDSRHSVPFSKTLSTSDVSIWRARGSRSGRRASSVLVNPEQPDSVQLRKLGDEHGEQRHRVDDEVDPVVLGVEAGEEVQYNRCDGEELA